MEKRFWFKQGDKYFYSDMTYRCSSWPLNDYTHFYITEDGMDIQYTHSNGYSSLFSKDSDGMYSNSDGTPKKALIELIEQINLHITLELERAMCQEIQA